MNPLANSTIPIDKPVIINTSTAFAESSTIAYTGVSFRIPRGTIYAFRVYTGYENHQPVRTVLSSSSTTLQSNTILADGDTGREAYICGYAQADLTVYIWAAFSGAGNNSVAIVNGWYKYI